MVVQRFERNDHLDGGAVGISNQALMVLKIVAVHFGDHQRDPADPLRQAELLSITTAPALGCNRRVFLYSRRFRLKTTHDVNSAKRVFGEHVNVDLGAAKSHVSTGGFANGSRRSTGNVRASKVASISAPTAPVAPTTATV